MVSSREPRGEVLGNAIVDALLCVLPLPIVWLGPDGRVHSASPAACRCFARDPEDLIGLEAEALASPAAAAAWRELLTRAKAGEQVAVDRGVFPAGGTQAGERRGRNGHGGGNHHRETTEPEASVGFVLAPLRGPGREYLGAVLYEDVTELRGIGEMLLDVNRELRHLVRADPLTGLANRREYERLLRTEVARAARTRSPVSLLMIDVDGVGEARGLIERWGSDTSRGDQSVRAPLGSSTVGTSSRISQNGHACHIKKCHSTPSSPKGRGA